MTDLKLKYRNPNRKWRFSPKNQVEPGGGCWVYNAGRFNSKARTGNSHGPTPKPGNGKGRQGTGVRKRAYGPW